MITRKCIICRVEKDLLEFRGGRLVCRECGRIAARNAPEEKKQKSREATKRWRVKNKKHVAEYMRRASRRRRYGLSDEIFQELLKIQGGKCAICRDEFTRTPSVDHDHDTGRIRGLLCSPCNTGLGLFKESYARLVSAVEYLSCHYSVCKK